MLLEGFKVVRVVEGTYLSVFLTDLALQYSTESWTVPEVGCSFVFKDRTCAEMFCHELSYDHRRNTYQVWKCEYEPAPFRVRRHSPYGNSAKGIYVRYWNLVTAGKRIGVHEFSNDTMTSTAWATRVRLIECVY